MLCLISNFAYLGSGSAYFLVKMGAGIIWVFWLPGCGSEKTNFLAGVVVAFGGAEVGGPQTCQLAQRPGFALQRHPQLSPKALQLKMIPKLRNA